MACAELAEALLDRPMAARVSKTGAVRVDEARVLGGVDPRALSRRIRHVSVRVLSGAAEKKVTAKIFLSKTRQVIDFMCRCVRRVRPNRETTSLRVQERPFDHLLEVSQRQS
jgi:hypothetical protein